MPLLPELLEAREFQASQVTQRNSVSKQSEDKAVSL